MSCPSFDDSSDLITSTADMDSPTVAPSTPTEEYSRPILSRSSSSLSGLVSRGAERVGEEWSEGLVLLDVVETFFDSRLDLWERKLKDQSSRLKKRAGELLPKGLRTPGGRIMVVDDDGDSSSGPRFSERLRMKNDLDIKRLKVKFAERVNKLSASWASEKVVRKREAASFVLGVCTLAFTCLLYGLAPEWFPFAYTVQAAVYMPFRVYSYKRKGFHYFLFGAWWCCNVLTADLCYFVNVLDMLWIWFFPSSTILFVSCYCLTMGPLASAIITWRNSLVFHSIDKVTSLFIHIYPPIVFDVILFRWPGAEERFPAIANFGYYNWWQRIAISAVPYCAWQLAYWKFISVDRHDKIKSGQRENSFHFLLNDKHNPIGAALRGIKEDHREHWFMFGQLIYSIIFMIPASALFIHSARATVVCLVVLFLQCTWNGATFYVEVFGRKFERELERLRKEMEAMSQSGRTPSEPGTPYVDSENPKDDRDIDRSPLVLPTSQDESIPAIDIDSLGQDKTEGETSIIDEVTKPLDAHGKPKTE